MPWVILRPKYTTSEIGQRLLPPYDIKNVIPVRCSLSGCPLFCENFFLKFVSLYLIMVCALLRVLNKSKVCQSDAVNSAVSPRSAMKIGHVVATPAPVVKQNLVRQYQALYVRFRLRRRNSAQGECVIKKGD